MMLIYSGITYRTATNSFQALIISNSPKFFLVFPREVLFSRSPCFLLGIFRLNYLSPSFPQRVQTVMEWYLSSSSLADDHQYTSVLLPCVQHGLNACAMASTRIKLFFFETQKNIFSKWQYFEVKSIRKNVIRKELEYVTDSNVK